MKQNKKIAGQKKGVTLLILCLFLLTLSSLAAAKNTSEKGYLGVTVTGLSDEKKDDLNITHGVMITTIVEGEAAEKAGLKEDDVILYFNHEKIRRVQDLIDAVRDVKPGTKVEAKILRQGEKKGIPVILGKRKSALQKRGLSGGKQVFFSTTGSYLGVHLQRLNEDLAAYFGVKADEGVLIMEVVKDSPAEKAGLKSGDVIVKFNDQSNPDANQIQEIISDLDEGDEVRIQIMRHHKKKNVTAVLGKGPKFRGFQFFDDTGKGRFHFNFPEMHLRFPSIRFEHPGIDFDDSHLKEMRIYRKNWDKKYKKEREEILKESKKKQRKNKVKIFKYFSI